MCARVLCVHAVPRPYVLKLSTEFLSDCSIVAHSRLASVSETSLLANESGESVSFETRNPPRVRTTILQKYLELRALEFHRRNSCGRRPGFRRRPRKPSTAKLGWRSISTLYLTAIFISAADVRFPSKKSIRPFIGFLSQFSDQFHGFNVDRALSVSSRTCVTTSASTKWKKLAWNSRYMVNGSVFERRHRFLRLITRPRLLSSGSQRSTTETARFKRYRGGLITREIPPRKWLASLTAGTVHQVRDRIIHGCWSSKHR